jgi:hypothetical protein
MYQGQQWWEKNAGGYRWMFGTIGTTGECKKKKALAVVETDSIQGPTSTAKSAG